VRYNAVTMAVNRFPTRDHAILADLSRLREAREFADAAAAAFGLDDEARYQVKLAMSEAVTNAIQHGSSSPEDRVILWVVEETGALAFYIKDTGRFRPRMAPRGDLPERGRGLDFMRQLMDEVDVRPDSDGTTLRFVKRP
jgi:anti-sigma regulatory factor (Ser/Thr protein kinase)